MEQLRSFAGMLCIAAVACCVFKMLLPESALEPALKTVLSIFFLLCLLTPLSHFKVQLPGRALLEEETQEHMQPLSETYSAQLERAVSANLSKVILMRLEKMGVSAAKLSIKVNTNAQGSIDISEVEVFLNPENAFKAPEIEAYISGELELPCTVRSQEAEVVGNGS